MCAGGVRDRGTETDGAGPSAPARAKATRRLPLCGPHSLGGDAPFPSADKNTEKTVGVTGQVSAPASPAAIPVWARWAGHDLRLVSAPFAGIGFQ